MVLEKKHILMRTHKAQGGGFPVITPREYETAAASSSSFKNVKPSNPMGWLSESQIYTLLVLKSVTQLCGLESPF